jgi:hypothetical protein
MDLPSETASALGFDNNAKRFPFVGKGDPRNLLDSHYCNVLLSQVSAFYRMMVGSSTTWLILLRRGPCLPSWWRSSGSCGMMVEYKPALTELQSTSSMTRHLSKSGKEMG